MNFFKNFGKNQKIATTYATIPTKDVQMSWNSHMVRLHIIAFADKNFIQFLIFLKVFIISCFLVVRFFWNFFGEKFTFFENFTFFWKSHNSYKNCYFIMKFFSLLCQVLCDLCIKFQQISSTETGSAFSQILDKIKGTSCM